MHLQSIQELDELFRIDAATRFEDICARDGERLAVRSPTRSLSYAQLDAQANQLANALLRVCAQHRFVALLFEHDVDMIVGVLGALKAGLAYVPLDASYPRERLRYMLAAAGHPMVVTVASLVPLAQQLGDPAHVIVLETTLAGATAERPQMPRSLDAPAYLLFTSGSTGQPKGVMQTHRNLLYHTWVWITRLGITQDDRLSLQSAYSWDSSVQDIFGALLSGAAVYPVDLKTQGFPATLEWMRQERISVYHSTLPIYRQAMKLMQERQWTWPSLRMLAVGGDSVYASDIDLCTQVLAPDCALAYAYGASESSTILMNVIQGKHALGLRHSLTLGTAAPHVHVYLDHDGMDLDGEGEIVIASDFVCPGYHAQPLDRSKFTTVPGDDKRIHFRTGDIAVKLDSGAIALVGRRDNVVKVRGMRVDTAEVEGVLNAIAGVDCAVVQPADLGQERILVAYVVRAAHVPPHNVSTLTAVLAERLPAHAMPSRYVFLAALPMTPNGKIDRLALPRHSDARPELAVEFAPSQSSLQRELIIIWQEVLGIAGVGIHDNFFDLGGQSLMLIRVHARMQQELRQTLALFQLYAYPTIAALTAHLDNDEQHRSALGSAARRASQRRQRRALPTTSL